MNNLNKNELNRVFGGENHDDNKDCTRDSNCACYFDFTPASVSDLASKRFVFNDRIANSTFCQKLCVGFSKANGIEGAFRGSYYGDLVS